MRIRWTVPAADDLSSIKQYLDEHHPRFSQSTIRTIYGRVHDLKSSPNKGMPGHLLGPRELVITPLPYIVFYSVNEDAVEVLHIYHGARDWLFPK